MTLLDDFGLAQWPFMPVFAQPTVAFERGSGTELWDTTGKRYLDFLSGLAVCSLGHAHPAVTEALSTQAATLLHVSNYFANPPAVAAAVALDSLLDEVTGHGGQVFFGNSGAEANECAIKLARKFGGRGRHTVVSALGSFHGRTLATLAATGQPAKHEPFAPMPEGFKHVAFGDLDALRGAVDGTVAAVLIEPIQGEGGVNPAPEGYLRGVRQLCDDVGALMIVDEIQTGLARTGTWFAFEQSGLTGDAAPDVVTIAKALGNGVPVGACWARGEVAGVFQPGDHGSTYAATALAGAVVGAVLAELRKIDAPTLAARRGARLTELLLALPQIESVRGAGLMLGAELVAGLDSHAVYREALDRGLVINAVTGSTLRFLPPLTVSDDELAEGVAILAAVLEDLA